MIPSPLIYSACSDDDEGYKVRDKKFVIYLVDSDGGLYLRLMCFAISGRPDTSYGFENTFDTRSVWSSWPTAFMSKYAIQQSLVTGFSSYSENTRMEKQLNGSVQTLSYLALRRFHEKSNQTRDAIVGLSTLSFSKE
ncbi:hypothetical protein QCA50_006606 [Cerrena zonata]|uniref:Uncharacterized protein n=1 Tax=Cerrena zonata TaxID=2478898 RepID=A0AAW0GAT3_9APHY